MTAVPAGCALVARALAQLAFHFGSDGRQRRFIRRLGRRVAAARAGLAEREKMTPPWR